MKSKEEILKDNGIYPGFKSTYTYESILAAMDEYASQQAPASTPPVSAMEDGWVDVRNALPDNEGLYLAWVTNHSFLGPPESFFIVYYGFANDEDATEMFWSYMMKPIDVTHWRPLPPPPSNR